MLQKPLVSVHRLSAGPAQAYAVTKTASETARARNARCMRSFTALAISLALQSADKTNETAHLECCSTGRCAQQVRGESIFILLVCNSTENWLFYTDGLRVQQLVVISLPGDAEERHCRHTLLAEESGSSNVA